MFVLSVHLRREKPPKDLPNGPNDFLATSLARKHDFLVYVLNCKDKKRKNKKQC